MRSARARSAGAGLVAQSGSSAASIPASASPVAFLYDKAAGRQDRFGTATDFPYIATSYRLTEHEHYVTQHVPHLVGLQPHPFVEIPEDVARGYSFTERIILWMEAHICASITSAQFVSAMESAGPIEARVSSGAGA